MEILFQYGLGFIFLIICATTAYETIAEDEKCRHSDHSLYCTEIPKDLPDNVTHVYLKFDRITIYDTRYHTGILDGGKWKAVKYLHTNEIDRFALNKPLIALPNLEQLVINVVALEPISRGLFKGLSRLKILKIYVFELFDITMLKAINVIQKDYPTHSPFIDRYFEDIYHKYLTALENNESCRYIITDSRQFEELRNLKVLKFYQLHKKMGKTWKPFCTYTESFSGLNQLKHLHIEGLLEVNPNALARLKRLKKLSVTPYSDFTFRTKTFAGLVHLKVFQATGVREVKPYSLASLKQLQKLSITVSDNFIFHKQSFAGLNNLKILRWSGSGRIGIKVETITSAIRRLPNLMEFSFSDVSIWHSRTPLNTYQSLMKLRMLLDALFSKPLTSLILYNIRASETFLFELLKYTGHKGNHFRAFLPFKRVNATLCRPQNIENDPSHNASIDLNVTTSTLQLQLPIFVSIQGTINITGIYAENKYIDLKNVTAILWGNCEDPIKHIIIRNVGLRFLDVKLVCKESMLEKLDMPSNEIEFLNPKLCACCSRLVEINLSNNKLFKMADQHYSLFGQVLVFYRNLKVIHLSSNRLTTLPKEMFKNNRKLELIDLSYNLMASVGFRIKHLRNLKSLNLQNNRLIILDQQSFTNLKTVLRAKQTALKHYGGIYKFGDNPFSCSQCDTLPSLKWLATTRLVNRFGQNVTCLALEKRLIPLTQNAVKHLQWECDKQKRLRNTILLSISITLGIAILSLIALYMWLKYRQMERKQKDLREKLELFRLNRLNVKYLVFLSHNSNDTDFTIEYVYNPLNQHLQQHIGIDRDTVCLGDSHFQLGKPINDEMVVCLQQSAVVLLLLSRNFCESEYCRMEFDHALRMNKPFILMVKDDVDVNEMVPSLQELFMRNTRLLWERKGDIYEMKTSWDNVLESVLELVP